MKEKDINNKPLYQNHYQMKKIRLIKLQQTQGKCEVCGNRAYTIHHKDESIDNHSLENLMVLCNSCHKILHHSEDKKNHTSLFIRIYGITLEKIAKQLNFTMARCYQLHKKDKLKELLK